MWCHAFDPPLGKIFSVEGIFPLEGTWVVIPFPQNSFGWEYKTSLCSHVFHPTDSKDPDIYVPEGWMTATKTHPASTKTEYDYLNGWIKKTVTYTQISPKMVNPRDIAGECKRRRKIPKYSSLPWTIVVQTNWGRSINGSHYYTTESCNGWINASVHTHTHTHTHTLSLSLSLSFDVSLSLSLSHTHTRTHTHMHTPLLSLSLSLSHSHTHTHARTHAHTHAHTHACTHASMHAHTYKNTHMRTQSRLVNACIIYIYNCKLITKKESFMERKS